ncbi:hypothetical protein [Mesorhizobium sp. WSM3626]|uniref:hypothetical protein n=1 Tax=Mesorhizobium sp. WSM3626 TaxID=1040987 RepID=UPI0004896950|nr:hypothetical protein [Mesorhizobium sp. WSM3626]
MQVKAAAEKEADPAVCAIPIAGEDRPVEHAGAAKHEVPASADRVELEIGESRLVLTDSVDPTLSAAFVDALHVRAVNA